ncbi:hypothetical protein [Sinorhizobium meliloti]|uniref:hypothetical protein n=1 Tax=Rhizobium meliloti TaxID=382 RepID=UPI000FD71C04|nr:hypothetical protein [Sinorhizobium meliloti]QGJ73834.1 hypothetical protein C3L21_07320 [Sinorhizobium meliloti]RVG89007.1 hypothetical protein CN218_25985 [Sinorhizobium meliloti]RVK90472.1 hypothetical protein CN150_27725 [Sinorhizobium meliloti]RVL60706.1 hypothetical protein CN137_18060 [Sinorhizobium meliloti]
MTKRTPIKQADLNRLAVVAKRNNITIEVEGEGYTIRLHPYSASPAGLKPEEFSSFAEWQAWRDRERRLEPSRAPEPERDPAWDIPWEDIPPEPIQPPLNWRERNATDYLMTHGAEVRVDWYALKDFGTHTQKKLQERGFVDVSPDQDKYKHPNEIWLTKAGAKAIRDQRAHRDKYPCL